MKLQLQRPLVFFDLETTGIDPYNDRIVEISVLKILPDGTRCSPYTRRINPGRPIPAEATSVHHITDEMVKNEPTFEAIAPKLKEFLKDCDLAGYNSNRFDVPMLVEEFKRAGLPLDMSGVKLVDVQTIYHKREPRTLVAAYRHYCGRDLEGAHSAEADITATYEVLLGQLDMYDDLPRDIDGLAEYTSNGKSGRFESKITFNSEGEPCFNFSKFKGQTVKDVFTNNPGMINWCLDPQRSFPSDVLDIFKKVRDSIKENK